MLKQIRMLIILAVVLLVTGNVLAQEPVSPSGPDPSWRASYWNNTALSGTPVLEREEIELNHDWGSGSPHPNVSVNGFSARWTRYIYVSDGAYRFTVTSDDGIRVWVDNHLIIDKWYEHPAATFSAEKVLDAGHHWVVVEYYENFGLAEARLTWGPAATSVLNWRGEYFANMTLSGTPDLIRDDTRIDFDWGALSPKPELLGVDRFSARWTRMVNLPEGYYRFSMTIDDGGRLWVNGHRLIDVWTDQAARTYTEAIYLPGGDVPIKMEYYENGGNAVAKLAWELSSPTGPFWRGEYFNNTTLSGTPALIRDDATIDFNWRDGSPAHAIIAADGFSVRWARTVDLSAGRYRFEMTVDDGARLWVNQHLLIDAWHDQAAQTYNGEIDLHGGPVQIRMEYYENAGLAVATLSWSKSNDASIPGTVIVDDSDPGFVKGGSATGWRTASGGYDGTLTWTRNNDWQRPNYNWARWYPSLSPGLFEVFVFLPDHYTTTTSARYLISHAGGYTSRVVDQAANGDRWVSLGTYWFDRGTDAYVSLTDTTYETRLSRLIAFDAVKWVPR